MIRKIAKICGVLLLVLAITGCATVTRPLAQDYQPQEGDAYLYGRFSMEDSAAGYASVVFENEEGKKFGLKLVPQEKAWYQMIALPPCTYKWVDIQFMSILDELLTTIEPEAKPGYNYEFTIEAGQALYMGDIRGKIERVFSGWSFILYVPVDAYEATTAVLTEKFPFLADLELRSNFP